MNLLKKIFIFTLLLFPVGEVLRIDFGSGLVIRPLDIGVGLLVLTWLAFKILKKQKFKQREVCIPILLFILSGYLALIIGSKNLSFVEFFISFAYLIRWAVFAGVFFIIMDFDNQFKKTILNMLIFIGSLIVGLGFIQYFYYSNLQNLRYLGWDEHMFRMFSVFLDPNFAGAFFVLFFLLLANNFLKNKTVSIGILLILTLAAVFLTFSRSALIMLVVSSSLLFILMNKKRWMLCSLTFVLLALAISLKNSNNANINLFRVFSSEARLETAKNAISIIKNNPILGVGFNSYRYAQFRYGFSSEINATSHADAGTDNSLLFVIATTGLVGFILYLFLWYRTLKIASVLAVASIVGVFVDSMFINSLFYPFIMLWLWIILALSIKNHN